jgi:hypothetical protein
MGDLGSEESTAADLIVPVRITVNLAPEGGRAPRRAQDEGATVSEPPGLGDARVF